MENGGDVQPVCLSVVLFFCKGLILTSLLIQVLVTKHLEVHLQILLAVGLAVLCFCLVICCIICWWHQKARPSKDKGAGLSPASLPTDHVTVSLSPSPSINTLPIKQQYEELDGEVMDGGSTPSEDDLSAPSPPLSLYAVKGPHKSRFSLRRLSSPTVSSTRTKPAVRGRSSLPIIPKFSLVSKTRRAPDRSGSRAEENITCSESSRLTCRSSMTHYGSSALKPTPSLHFTLFFSPAESRLTVTVLGLYRGLKKTSGSTVRVCLPPVHPAPLHSGSTRRRSPDTPPQVFILQVTPEDICECTLMMTVSCRDFSGLRETPVGEVQLTCAEIHWNPGSTVTFNHPLKPAFRRPRKSQSSQNALGHLKSLLCPGQVLIVLQYQTLAHRMKVMIRKAKNLPKLTRIPGNPDHCVVINLRQNGKVISSKETKGASGANAVWNAPFLFDLPAGDISELPLVLELIVMQGRLYTKSCILGRVLIGCEGPDAGQQHWTEMCSSAQAETTHWHTLLPDTL
ncbi:synaptotagmin-4 isoform X1 [Triplophysa dalaica]|uniref:synaptotagmin-4 isoform X1 n=1 Tax=Triplophysa dalaica TaxID=1582913 RepID=UPI0024E01A55|nr:synaptotagmin-4 isoform X1 [Triplophysa dalaica]